MTIVLAGKRGITIMSVGSMRLRLDAEDGTAAREYRIDDGSVEVRNVQPPGGHDSPENPWQRLTPEQLSIQVERNTVVAQWLEHRLGWRRLLQACNNQETGDWRAADNDADRQVA
jgi:hypothetical protein